MPLPKLVSPSRIARYYFHECERYLRYSSTPRELLESEGVPEAPFDHSLVTAAILESGTTWEASVLRLVAAPEPQPFDIRHVRPPIETFLATELVPLMSSSPSEAFWHLYFRCEWCPYFAGCAEEMRISDDISRIPNLTSHVKRYLSGPD